MIDFMLFLSRFYFYLFILDLLLFIYFALVCFYYYFNMKISLQESVRLDTVLKASPPPF